MSSWRILEKAVCVTGYASVAPASLVISRRRSNRRASAEAPPGSRNVSSTVVNPSAINAALVTLLSASSGVKATDINLTMRSRRGTTVANAGRDSNGSHRGWSSSTPRIWWHSASSAACHVSCSESAYSRSATSAYIKSSSSSLFAKWE